MSVEALWHPLVGYGDVCDSASSGGDGIMKIGPALLHIRRAIESRIAFVHFLDMDSSSGPQGLSPYSLPPYRFTVPCTVSWPY